MISDVQKLLDRTNDGLQVFTHYLGDGCKNATFRNPYRDDERPSCRLYYRKSKTSIGGKWYFHDYGDSHWRGDCFWFVAKICSINLQSCFKDVLHIIDKEMNLFVLNDTIKVNLSYTPMDRKVVLESHKTISKIVSFTPTFQPFTKHELAYWNQYGITQEWLDRMGVQSIKSCHFVREDGTSYDEVSTYDEPVFAYTFPGTSFTQDGKIQKTVKGMKLYRPKSQKKSRFMYVGELPKPYLFGLRDFMTVSPVSTNDIIYITGGEKDVFSLLSHGFDAICFNSETAKISDVMIKALLRRYKWVVFLYDSDSIGKRESEERVKEFQPQYKTVCRLVLPLKGTKAEKDISDFFRMGHTSEELEALTRNTLTATINYKNQDI